MYFRGSPPTYHISPYTLYSWGQSAGALSITAHLVTSPVHPPFEAAILVRIGPFFLESNSTSLRSLLFNSSIRVIPAPSTRPIARNTKLHMIILSSSPDALQLLTLWNAYVQLHTPPLVMLSIPPLPYFLPTGWMLPGFFPSMENSSRSR